MELTHEETKKIIDAAMVASQRFCEFTLAKDRLTTMCNLSQTLLKMGLDQPSIDAAIEPYLQKFGLAQQAFLELLGAGEENKEFWEYSAKVDAERRAAAGKQTSTPDVVESDSGKTGS